MFDPCSEDEGSFIHCKMSLSSSMWFAVTGIPIDSGHFAHRWQEDSLRSSPPHLIYWYNNCNGYIFMIDRLCCNDIQIIIGSWRVVVVDKRRFVLRHARFASMRCTGSHHGLMDDICWLVMHCGSKSLLSMIPSLPCSLGFHFSLLLERLGPCCIHWQQFVQRRI